eukprot:TRINITY_DN7983_c0_g1_i1.p1 TRINITY_DN7983_c0_g1~~TRINITY_DN7983_c0_g1_i1.p1  ORF type:complete len:276 (-),score=54.68 TRINITY_DN7983_c0_g1_i1:47-874(-)
MKSFATAVAWGAGTTVGHRAANHVIDEAIKANKEKKCDSPPSPRRGEVSHDTPSAQHVMRATEPSPMGMSYYHPVQDDVVVTNAPRDLVGVPPPVIGQLPPYYDNNNINHNHQLNQLQTDVYRLVQDYRALNEENKFLRSDNQRLSHEINFIRQEQYRQNHQIMQLQQQIQALLISNNNNSNSYPLTAVGGSLPTTPQSSIVAQGYPPQQQQPMFPSQQPQSQPSGPQGPPPPRPPKISNYNYGSSQSIGNASLQKEPPTDVSVQSTEETRNTSL